jgi:hypothetical protein
MHPKHTLETALQQVGPGKLEIHMQKTAGKVPSLVLHKNKLKMDQRPKTFKLLEFKS